MFTVYLYGALYKKIDWIPVVGDYVDEYFIWKVDYHTREVWVAM